MDQLFAYLKSLLNDNMDKIEKGRWEVKDPSAQMSMEEIASAIFGLDVTMCIIYRLARVQVYNQIESEPNDRAPSYAQGQVCDLSFIGYMCGFEPMSLSIVALVVPLYAMRSRSRSTHNDSVSSTANAR
jgi:hypothetical protein